MFLSLHPPSLKVNKYWGGGVVALLSRHFYNHKIVQVSVEHLGTHGPDLLRSDFAEIFSQEYVG